MSEELYLVRVPLRPEKLVTFARQRGLLQPDLDDGYLAHCVMRELFGEAAPSPFVLRRGGRTLEAWGYSRVAAQGLKERALETRDQARIAALAGLDAVASRAMPRLDAGRKVGFVLRACPVVRLATRSNGHRAGAELDAFLARCFAMGPRAVLSREEVYRDWLAARLANKELTGVVPERVRVAGVSRERLLRRGHGADRAARRIERPDARFDGEVTVVDGDRLLRYLAHGVGRHRGFGFGALLLVPRGTSYTE